MIELDRAEDVVDAILERVGRDLKVGAPLAAGKPNHILNALYRRAKADSSIQLTILTALTLEKPKGASDLESRFLGPFAERVFGDYPDLDYELDRMAEALPHNVRVVEFYFPPGKYKDIEAAQRDYISSNYTHVARDVVARGLNVLVAQVAVETRDGRRALSLSCNPDTAVDALYEMAKMEAAGIPMCRVAQTNTNLPFMFGDAEVDEETFDILVDNRDEDYTVFGPPKMSVGAADHMIGLHVASLVRDGGELQIGIGAIGDAIVNALRFRHHANDAYREVLDELAIAERFGDVVDAVGGDQGTFETGLFSASEMMVDGFLQLFEDGIIKRKVYDHVGIQRLLNLGVITQKVGPETLVELLRHRAVHPVLDEQGVHDLVWFGVFAEGVRLDGETLIAPDGTELSNNMTDFENLQRVLDLCLGTELRHGAVMHAGFFLGPRSFYAALREMPEERRKLIRMRSVRRINQLYGHEDIDVLHRVHGRFVNTAMQMTLFGAACSDALGDGTVVSGVGGQFNFVVMAHELPDGRSILNLRSTRTHAGQLLSNIVLQVGHVTIPRHLRDLVVTEYGIADLRAKTDEECVKAMLNIADSRFQAELMAQAKDAGKLARSYVIPPEHRMNLPERYEAVLARHPEHFPAFPLGTDLDDTEIALGKALKYLKKRTEHPSGTAALVARAMTHAPGDEHRPYLERMGYSGKLNQHDWLYSRMVCLALDDTGATGAA